MVYTKKQYLNSECTHDEYYAEFVTPMMTDNVKRFIGEKHIKESKCPYLNPPTDIPNRDSHPLSLKKWDRVGAMINTPRLHELAKEKGTVITKSDLVCIAKASVKNLIKI